MSRHALANVLRNLAEIIDSQPPIQNVWIFHRQAPTGTNSGDVYLTLRKVP